MLLFRFTLLVIVIRQATAVALFTNSSSSSCPPSTTITVSSTATSLSANPSLSAGCSSCTIHGGDVQVYWWPTASDGQQIKTMEVDAAGFTFNSPSIYVAFSTLYTADACSTGPSLPATTIAFPQDALSTATGWRWNTAEYLTRPPRLDSSFILATWGNKVLDTCTYVTSSFWQPLDGPFQNYSYPDTAVLTASFGASFIFDAASWAEYTVSYNPCSPTLSAPQQVFTLEPGWENCVRGIEGFFDPPYALSVGGPLVSSPTSTSSPVEVAVPTTAIAVEGSTPTPVTAAPTVVSTTHPLSSSIEDPSPASVIPNNSGNNPSTQPVDPTVDTMTTSGTLTPFVVIGSQTIAAGQPSITVSGIPVSLEQDGSSLVIGSLTRAVSSLLSPTPLAPSLAYVLDSQTLTPGGPAITVTDTSGKSSVISLQPGASNVVVGGSTIPVAEIAGLKTATPDTSSQPVLAGLIILIGGYGTSGSATVSISTNGDGSGGEKTTSTPAVQATGIIMPVGYNGTAFTGAATPLCSKNTWVKGLSLGMVGLIALLSC